MGVKWIFKAVVQKGISYLPFSQQINYFFQKNITGGVRLDDNYFGLKLGHAADHLDYFRTYGSPGVDRRILELGTGWYPVVPLLFWLTSSGRVTSIDIRQWMNAHTQYLTVMKYREWMERGMLGRLEPLLDRERWDQLMKEFAGGPLSDTGKFNEMVGMVPVVGDTGSSGLEESSVDFICSNNTFEHIPAPVLERILKEFLRVIAPGGVMSHFIDMSDHFAHFDPSITIYHFLKFSNRQWRFIDNNIQPQNRLRFNDYLSMYQRLGIPVTEKNIREGDLAALQKVRVHPQFSGYLPGELAVSHAYIISHFEPASAHSSRNSSRMM